MLMSRGRGSGSSASDDRRTLMRHMNSIALATPWAARPAATMRSFWSCCAPPTAEQNAPRCRLVYLINVRALLRMGPRVLVPAFSNADFNLSRRASRPAGNGRMPNFLRIQFARKASW